MIDLSGDSYRRLRWKLERCVFLLFMPKERWNMRDIKPDRGCCGVRWMEIPSRTVFAQKRLGTLKLMTYSKHNRRRRWARCVVLPLISKVHCGVHDINPYWECCRMRIIGPSQEQCSVHPMFIVAFDLCGCWTSSPANMVRDAASAFVHPVVPDEHGA